MKRKAVAFFSLAVLVIVSVSLTDALSQQPVPAVRINDMSGSIQLAQPNTFKLSLSLNSGENTGNADWWLAAATPAGIYFLSPAGWTPTVAPVYQGPLLNIPPLTLFDFPVTGLPPSTFAFYFGIDTEMDGAITGDRLFFDWAEVSFADSPQPVQGAAKVTVPVLMYYLERYFTQAAGPTDHDKAIASVLDNSPQNRTYFRSLLDAYRAIPSGMKILVFDQSTLQITANVTAPLDLSSVRQRIAFYDSELMRNRPDAPTGLAAKNASVPPDPDTPGSDKFQVELKWVDNSADEDGFVVYRAKQDALTNKLTIVSSQKVAPGVMTFIDKLAQPSNIDDQYCYQVTAFRQVGQKSIESDLSNVACSYYHWVKLPQPPDADKDGFSDSYDKCPFETGINLFGAEGCPDLDADGVADKDDSCPITWGEGSDGCPLRYNIRWMGMKVLNNSGTVAYYPYQVIDAEGKVLYDMDSDDEEPYLLFTSINGMTQGGMAQHWVANWCCGEKVNVKKGDDFEPDNDISGEETYNTSPLLQDLLNHGHTVFPEFQKQFAEIDKKFGLAMTVSLREHDGLQTVTLDEADKLGDAVKLGGVVAGAVSTCVGTGGFGCLAAIGKAIKDFVDTIFGWMQPSQTVTIDNPEDHMGSVSWVLDRSDAAYKTSTNGTYGFSFDVPKQYTAGCLYIPCSVANSVPWTMRARVYFCLYREGIQEKDLKSLCGNLTSYANENPNVQ